MNREPSLADIELDDRVAGPLRPPALLIEFELERAPRVLNGRDLSEAELRRLTDWITSHDGGINRALWEWVERHLALRRQGAER